MRSAAPLCRAGRAAAAGLRWSGGGGRPRASPPGVAGGTLAAGDEVAVRCERLAFGGAGVCKTEAEHGKGPVLFVDGALPGERLVARVRAVKRRHAEGVKVETLQEAPAAVDAPCAHLAACGGCALQGLAYRVQLDEKRQHVEDALRRIGGLRGADVRDAVGAAEGGELRYRNKVEFAVDDVDGTVGLRARGSRRVVDVASCLLLPAVADRVYGTVRELLPRDAGVRRFVVRTAERPGTPPELMVELIVPRGGCDAPSLRDFAGALVGRHAEVVSVLASEDRRPGQGSAGRDARVVVLAGARDLVMELRGVRFGVSSGSFFQVNTSQAERLIEAAEEAAQFSADGSDVLLDLFCGVGTLSLPLAARCREVHGVEVVAAAVADANANASENGVSNAFYHVGDLTDPPEGVPTPDVVITDPPRSGMSEATVDFLRECGARRLVYVSCNPATQARDVARLCAPGPGAFALEHVVPVDMFPHTPHIESVAALSRIAP